MKFFENSFNYDYSFPAVSLAYFLRYPNPYSRHVLASDVVDRYVDPATNRLHTTRLHLKRSTVPSAMLKMLPKGIGGSDNSGQSVILETSVVDVKEGWMETESRNMEWTGILSVVEKQFYRRCVSDETSPLSSTLPSPTLSKTDIAEKKGEWTSVKTTVTFKSRLGQNMVLRRNQTDDEDHPKKPSLFAAWSASGIQRTIEIIGLRRTRDAVLRSKLGMNIVLERLRNGGIGAVVEGMRQDREGAGFGHESRWKQTWLNGVSRGQKKNNSNHQFDDDE